MTVSKPRLVRLQLAETKSTWQGRAAAITAALHVSDDVTTFLKKLARIVRHSDHQLDSDMRLVPNYPCWIPGKSTLSLDKLTFFPCINTNSLTPTGAKPSLDLRNTFSIVFFAFTLLFSATYYIYSKHLLRHYWPYHLSLFGKYHMVPPPLSLATTWFPNIFSSKSIRNITQLYTRVCSANIGSREKSHTNNDKALILKYRTWPLEFKIIKL